MQSVGLIGLGKIGLPLAANLIAAGHRLVGYRRHGMADLEALGGVAAASPAALAAAVDILLICLPDDAALAEVVDGAAGVGAGARPGLLAAIVGSHPVEVKQRHADALSAKGVVVLDGEISGTPGMVRAHKASVYLAGPADSVEVLRPVAVAAAGQCHYLGAFGDATKVKLINNLLVALDIAGTAQAMAVALKLGLDPQLLVPAVMGGSGGSTQFGIRAAWMAEGRFLPQQGAAAVLLKYLVAVRRLAEEAGVSTLLIDHLADIYRSAVPQVGERDVAAIIELFEQPNRTGVTQ